MSRTWKDLKYSLKYPHRRWGSSADTVLYKTVVKVIKVVYEFDVEAGKAVPVKLDKPKYWLHHYHVQTKTTRPKLRRSKVTEHYHMYSSAPGWWIRETMTRPKRRACRVWERKVLFQDIEEADCPDFGRKPFNYYY